MSEFKREERYIVVKLKHLAGLQVAPLRNFLRENRVPTLDCVVVESDWPEYMPVWQMIERRMTGQPAVTAAEELDAVLHWRGKHAQAIRERDALQQRLTAADEQVDRLKGLWLEWVSCTGQVQNLEEFSDRVAAELAGLPPAYPKRLCHIDYTAHPYICGCLKGDEEAQRRFDEHQAKAAQHQGEPVAWMALNADGFPEKCRADDPHGFPVYGRQSEQPAPVAADYCVLHRGEPCQCIPYKPATAPLDYGSLDAVQRLALCRGEQPVAVELPDRSPEDYAIEHAEYMAKSADDVLAKFQAYGLARLAVDEGGDDGEGELLENIDDARGDLQESLVELRSMVYEFRKRAAKSR